MTLKEYIDLNYIAPSPKLFKENRCEKSAKHMGMMVFYKEPAKKAIAKEDAAYEDPCMDYSDDGEENDVGMFGFAPAEAAPAAYHLPKPKKDEKFKIEPSLSETLQMYVDKSGMTDAEVYKKAYINKAAFNKIKNRTTRTPEKRTLLALAIAMELTIDETNDLLSKAGLALSHSEYYDLIVEYHIKEGNYNFFKIDNDLADYGLKLFAG